eukprot:scaffold14882_cov193-Alexandrium_tamarense.AAC.3
MHLTTRVDVVSSIRQTRPIAHSTNPRYKLKLRLHALFGIVTCIPSSQSKIVWWQAASVAAPTLAFSPPSFSKRSAFVGSPHYLPLCHLRDTSKRHVHIMPSTSKEASSSSSSVDGVAKRRSTRSKTSSSQSNHVPLIVAKKEKAAAIKAEAALSSQSTLTDSDAPSSSCISTTSVNSETKRKASSAVKTEEVSSSSSQPLNSNNRQLLEGWINHTHHSYHLDTFLSPTQAYKIRTALVEWYVSNRRKLPWRGDYGPFDGSTAGYGSTVSVKGKTFSKGKAAASKKRSDSRGIGTESGKDIRLFFSANSTVKRAKLEGPAKTTLEVEHSLASTPSNDHEVNAECVGDVKEIIPRKVTAYGVWVSEIMLQQTRVESVIPYYLKWMDKFPTVHDLANASEEEVNSHWAGLGFYRRSRLLHAGAKRVVKDYKGIVPNTVDELLKIEGVGRYTASAVASIAYGVEVPVVDGNVCRVLSRLTGVANHIKAGVMKDDLGWTLAERIVKANGEGERVGTPGEVNQALMELGATYCSPSGSGIDEGDPLKEFYASTQLGVAIGASMCFGSSPDDRILPSLSTEVAVNGKGGKANQCRLCDCDGVFSVFFDITDRINAASAATPNAKPDDLAAISGHAAMPTAPPKKAKREVLLAVAVLKSQTADNEDCWLMVKRPSKGLLAGQWEFPAVCVYTSSDEKKNGKEKATLNSSGTAVPFVDETTRAKALDEYLLKVLSSEAKSPLNGLPPGVAKRANVNESIVHIFSHVSHTMWIECGQVAQRNKTEQLMRWMLNDGQEAGWFTASDMAAVGITSGVRKVLAVAQSNNRHG